MRVPDLAAKKTGVKNQGEASAVPYLRLSHACVTVIYSAIPSSPLSIILRLHLLIEIIVSVGSILVRDVII